MNVVTYVVIIMLIWRTYECCDLCVYYHVSMWPACYIITLIWRTYERCDLCGYYHVTMWPACYIKIDLIHTRLCQVMLLLM